MYELQETYNDMMCLDLTEEEMDLALNSLKDSVEEKAENIAMILNQFEAEKNMYDNEIKRLTAKKKAIDSKASKLKEYLATSLQSMNIDKLQGKLFEFSFRKSESVTIDDETLIPKEFIKVKTTESADKTAIKKALKLFIPIEGCHLEIKQNLQIK